MVGQPVQLVALNPTTKKLELNFEVLQTILLQENIKDNELSVVSIAGAFRKGKSFLLSFFLRYLDETIVKNNSANWLGDVNKPLTGFSWTGGSERHTTGIWIWSEIFTYTLPNGKKTGILLMDTQGTFDNNSSMRENVTIFSFSIMLSSIQIYNIFNNIQENDLQNLQLFTEYGKLAMKENSLKPFQELLFLIRDWSYPYESPYGSEGGKALLNKILEIKENQPEELSKIRRNIVECFDKLSCFLMPYPGKKAAMDNNFDGKISDLDPDFVEQLKILADLILNKNHLTVKKANGNNLTSKEFLNYVQTYWKIFESENLPNPTTIYEATSEANCLAAIETGQLFYETNMQKISAGGFIEFSLLATKHSEFHKYALKLVRSFLVFPKIFFYFSFYLQFEENALIGDEKIKRKYVIKLSENLQKSELIFFIQNQSRHTEHFNQMIQSVNLEVQQLLNENAAQNSEATGLESQIAGYRATSDAEKGSLRNQIAVATEAKRVRDEAARLQREEEERRRRRRRRKCVIS